jgi:hypothetical protein
MLRGSLVDIIAENLHVLPTRLRLFCYGLFVSVVTLYTHTNIFSHSQSRTLFLFHLMQLWTPSGSQTLFSPLQNQPYPLLKHHSCTFPAKFRSIVTFLSSLNSLNFQITCSNTHTLSSQRLYTCRLFSLPSSCSSFSRYSLPPPSLPLRDAIDVCNHAVVLFPNNASRRVVVSNRIRSAVCPLPAIREFNCVDFNRVLQFSCLN